LNSKDKLAQPDFPVPISFMYGDVDWMDSSGSEAVVRANKHFSKGECQLYVVSDSSHHVNMDNPEEFIERLTEDFLGTIKHTYETKKQMFYLERE